MHNDIITQNVKLVDEKLFINDKKLKLLKVFNIWSIMYQVMEQYHLKKEIVKDNYIVRTKRKKVLMPP